MLHVFRFSHDKLPLPCLVIAVAHSKGRELPRMHLVLFASRGEAVGTWWRRGGRRRRSTRWCMPLIFTSCARTGWSSSSSTPAQPPRPFSQCSPSSRRGFKRGRLSHGLRGPGMSHRGDRPRWDSRGTECTAPGSKSRAVSKIIGSLDGQAQQRFMTLLTLLNK